jgi:TetR/AcrR family transcriptional regulator, fatty acid biosynthesis regulator
MGIRAEQKQRTRAALIAAALEMVADGRAFSSLSLREVTRAAGVVPTAFYRHFPTMDALGMAIVEEALPDLRTRMRELRQDASNMEELLVASINVFFEFVLQHAQEFLFFGREITGGSSVLRNTLRLHVVRFSYDLADDLARIGYANHLNDQERFMVADLLVRAVLTTSQDLLAVRNNKIALDTLRHRTAQQMRLVVIGMLNWSSKPLAAVS